MAGIIKQEDNVKSDWWKENCAKLPAFTYVLRAKVFSQAEPEVIADCCGKKCEMLRKAIYYLI